MPAEYYQPEYDSVAGELALLPRMFTEGDLEHVVEERSGVLEVQPNFCTNPLTKTWQTLAQQHSIVKYGLSRSMSSLDSRLHGPALFMEHAAPMLSLCCHACFMLLCILPCS